MFITPAGVYVGRDYPGEKKQVFDSVKEYRRFLLLCARQAAGLISNLRTHRPFPLHALGGKKITVYEADFDYRENGLWIIEDVKSAMTRTLPMYRMKKRWMKAEWGIDIAEV